MVAFQVFCDKGLREQIQTICMERYGAKTPLESPVIQQKIVATNIERYGVEHPMQSKKFQNKAAETIMNRYGVSNIMYVEDVVSKGVETRGKNNITQTKPQRAMYELTKELGYKCEIDYHLHRYEFDVAVFVDDQKIDLEYDGMYWHQHHLEHDAERDARSIAEGWKVIRFQSWNGIEAPTKEQIKAAINAAIYEGCERQIIPLAA